MKKSAQEKILIPTIAAIILAIVGVVLFSLGQRQKINTLATEVENTRSVLLRLSNFYNTVIEHADGARQFSISGSQDAVHAIEETAGKLRSEVANLRIVFKDKPDQQIFLDSLSKYVGRRIEFSNQIVKTGTENSMASALALYQSGVGRDLNNQLFSVTNKIQSREMNYLQQKQEESTALIRKLSNYLIGLLAIVFTLMIVLISKFRMDLLSQRKSEEAERKKSEDLIRIKDQHLDLIYNTTADIIFLLSVEGDRYRFTSVNKAFMTTTGLNESDVIGRYADEVIPEASQELVFNKYKQAIQTRETVEWEEVSEYPAGRKTGIVSITPVCDEDGKCSMLVGTVHDITERKNIAELVIKERDLSNSIINSLPGVFYLVDNEGKYLRWNKNLEIVTGYSSSEINNLPRNHFIVEEDKPKVREAIQKVYTEGYSTIEANILTRDGTKIPYFLTGIAVTYENKPALLGTGLDISSRIKAEEAVRESEELYRALVDNATEALVVMDMEKQKFVSVSESAARLFKMSRKELMNVGPLEVSPEYQPDGRLSSEAAAEKLNEAIAGGKPSFEWAHRDADGKLISCEVWLVRLPSDNKILIRGTIIDISERKKAEEELKLSEQKYKLLFESNPLPMFMFSQSTMEFIDVNESAISHYGYSKKEFLNMKVSDLRPPEDVEQFMEAVVIPTRGKTYRGIWRHIKKNKDIITVEVFGHDIIYQGRQLRLALANDVTEKSLAEEKVKQSYEEIRQLSEHLQNIREEERTHIAREIHDELGQQLTVLKMDVSWLNKKLNDTDGVMKEKIKGIMDLIDGTVRSVRRIASELRPSLLDDLGLSAAIVWHLKEFDKRSGIHSKFVSDGSELVLPEAIKTGLFRIFQESLTNVARHADAKNIEVSLRKINGQIILSIQDDGRGFDRSKAARKKTLGILGMEERSLMMGGHYRISSQPGEGAIVTVSVPFEPQLT